MQKKGYRGGPDIHEAERQAAGLFAERFPLLDAMSIHMVYHQKGDNPILMTRTLHIYPDRDYVYFHIPCLIHDCDSGTFDLTPVVVNALKNAVPLVEGRLNCMGGGNKDLAPDHGVIQYRIEVSYKTPEQLRLEREAAIREEQAKKEVKPPVRKQAITKPISIVPERKAKAGAKRGLEAVKTTAAKGQPGKKTIVGKATKPPLKAVPKPKAKAVAKKPSAAKAAVKKTKPKSASQKAVKKTPVRAAKKVTKQKAVKKENKKVQASKPKAKVKGSVGKKAVSQKKTVVKPKASRPKASAKKKGTGRKK